MSKAFAAFALVLSVAAGARGNGAFPDEFSLHFPPNAPNRIMVGANFGLLISEDNGTTWRYTCEPWVILGSSAALSDAPVNFYQVTADGSAFLASGIEITRSTDVGCDWPPATGSVTNQVILDIFASPTDASLVLAIVAKADNSTYLVASHDGGKTFDGTHLLDTAIGVALTGVEISRSQPTVVYATAVSTSESKPATLYRSASSGDPGTWTPYSFDIPAASQPRILAVDPADANVVYLRLVSAINDGVQITTDGGQHFQSPFTINGQFTSFLRATDGTLYAGTANGELYVRRPPATSFDPQPLPAPHLRCLGQRFGEPTRIYACGDMVMDGFSIYSSDDGGRSFNPVMKFTQIRGPLTCAAVQTNCAAHWDRIQGVLGITDAGQGGGGGSDGGGGGGVGGGTPGGGSKGCATAASSGAILALLLLFAMRSRARG